MQASVNSVFHSLMWRCNFWILSLIEAGKIGNSTEVYIFVGCTYVQFLRLRYKYVAAARLYVKQREDQVSKKKMIGINNSFSQIAIIQLVVLLVTDLLALVSSLMLI
jgi:hypothetical protein